jgi:hypothetical protein
MNNIVYKEKCEKIVRRNKCELGIYLDDLYSVRQK